MTTSMRASPWESSSDVDCGEVVDSLLAERSLITADEIESLFDDDGWDSR